MNIADLLMDSPPLPRIEDPRARFYLDNYRTIETWAALRREVAVLLVEGLLDLASVFVADQERLGESIDVLPNDKGTHVFLRRPHWITGIGVGLEWTQGVFDRQADVSVYAGLQHDAGEVSGNNEERLVELATAAQPALGSAWTTGRGVWLLWRWIRPGGEAFDEQELYAQARREV